jgi:hypothetical protein
LGQQSYAPIFAGKQNNQRKKTKQKVKIESNNNEENILAQIKQLTTGGGLSP